MFGSVEACATYNHQIYPLLLFVQIYAGKARKYAVTVSAWSMLKANSEPLIFISDFLPPVSREYFISLQIITILTK